VLRSIRGTDTRVPSWYGVWVGCPAACTRAAGLGSVIWALRADALRLGYRGRAFPETRRVLDRPLLICDILGEGASERFARSLAKLWIISHGR